MALACGAGGVHLRSDSIAPAAYAASGFNRTPGASRTPADFLVGRSVHQLAEAVEHAPAVDYLIAGTVFPTVSKPAADRLLGESGLSRMAAAVRVPILAIGGVTLERVPAIAASGAAGIAGHRPVPAVVDPDGKLAAAVRAQFDRMASRDEVIDAGHSRPACRATVCGLA